jgi:type IV secretory pathway VirB2 component (pilin)
LIWLYNFIIITSDHSTSTSRNSMNPGPARKLCTMLGTATILSLPAPCQAAPGGLPWDPTLLAMQDMLVGTVAPAAIAVALTGAAILFALGGYDEQAGRLFGAGIGGSIALAIVHLLNYVLP